MNNYLIEGVSGTGKTTVCEELKKRGYKAVEADEEIAHYADPKTGLPTEEKIPDNWIWNEEKFKKTLQQEGDGPLFICGGAMNQEDFKHHFTKTFTLHIDDDTLRHRLLTRTNNDFGKHPDELALQLEWNKGAVAYSKQRGTILIDATKPVDEVINEILSHIELKQINQKVFFVDEKDIREKIENLFQTEKEKLQKLLPDSQIEHIGGTSVANSITKGDLDINIRVSKENFQTTIEILKKIYEINQPNNWTECYASFKYDSRDLGVQLTIIDSADDYFVKQRDFLNSHPEKVSELNQIKISFQGKNMEDYRKEKSNFFESIKL